MRSVTKEGPYDPTNGARGIETLIKSVETNGIGRNANVYAELGTTWRFVMRDPTTAAHLLGKLLKHIGEDNVLWGTDCSLVWLAAGPNPGLPKLSNHAGADRCARVS